MKVLYSCVALVACSMFLHAQNTKLDPSFGTNGISLTTVQNYYRNTVEAISVLPDGKIFLAGDSGTNTQSQMSIERLNPNGTIDNTFGTDGALRFNVGNGQSFIMDSKVQPDGKTVFTGYSWASNFTGDFVAIRLNADGTFDNTFGTNGIVVLDDGKNEVASALTILPNGKIILAGYVNDNFAMAQLNTDGSLDADFGIGGWVVTPISSTFSYASSIGVLSNGDIILGGFVYAGNGTQMAAVKYRANGNIDTAFGTNGVVAFNLSESTDFVSGVGIQADGKILLAGHAYAGTNPLRYDITIVRLNSNGSFDNSYGTNGVARAKVVQNGENYTSKLGMQPDGKPVVAGTTVEGNSWNACLVRFNTDGTLDSSFGTNGKISLDINNEDQEGRAIALPEDGSFIIGGYSYDKTLDISYMMAAKYKQVQLGVSDLNKGQVSLYPGVATHEITINLGNSTKGAEVSIYNISGQKVVSEKIGNTAKINVENWTPGTYLVQIKTGDQVSTKKFIKK